jgi:hypothetical protein
MNGKQGRENAAGIVAVWRSFYCLITAYRGDRISRPLFEAEWRMLQKAQRGKV